MTPAATTMAGATTNNYQLKAAAATVMEMVRMTARTIKMKTKATAALAAARRWQWQGADTAGARQWQAARQHSGGGGGGSAAAEAAALRQR
jgi:hypothetical protein